MTHARVPLRTVRRRFGTGRLSAIFPLMGGVADCGVLFEDFRFRAGSGWSAPPEGFRSIRSKSAISPKGLRLLCFSTIRLPSLEKSRPRSGPEYATISYYRNSRQEALMSHWKSPPTHRDFDSGRRLAPISLIRGNGEAWWTFLLYAPQEPSWVGRAHVSPARSARRIRSLTQGIPGKVSRN